MTDISQVAVELWDIEAVKPYGYNNKKHPPKHVEMLMKSIKAHGHLDPIVVDKNGVIISGHGRFEALKKLERKKVAVRVLRDISDGEASALRIAANKTVWNEYDTDALGHELLNLKDLDFDLETLGFDDKELSMLVADVGEINNDIIVDDMNDAIDRHETGISDKAESTDSESIRLDKAFGFKTVPLPDQKHITRFMAQVEESTGKSGYDALLVHMKEYNKQVGA